MCWAGDGTVKGQGAARSRRPLEGHGAHLDHMRMGRGGTTEVSGSDVGLQEARLIAERGHRWVVRGRSSASANAVAGSGGMGRAVVG